MTLDVFWFLPTSGDTRYFGKPGSGRPATNRYMQRIATTAEDPDFTFETIKTGLLISMSNKAGRNLLEFGIAEHPERCP